VTVDNDGLNLDVAADGAFFSVPFNCELAHVQLTVTNALAGTTPEVKFDWRPDAGSDTNRGDGDLGHIYLGVTGISAPGDVGYDLAGMSKDLEPGNEIVLQVTTAQYGADLGKIRPQVLVRYKPETMANLSAMTETA